MVEEFYLSQGLVFSKKREEIFLFNEFSINLEILKNNNIKDFKDYQKIINEMIDLLNLIKSKKIEICGLIENFKEIKENINKKNLKSISDKENEEFLQITSSPLIIEQSLELFKEIPIKNFNEFKEFEILIEKFQKKELDKIKLEIERIEQDLENLLLKLQESKKEYKSIKKKIEFEEEKQIVYLKKKEDLLEKKLNMQSSDSKLDQKYNKINLRIEKLKQSLEKNKLEEELIKNRIKILKKEKKLGRKKIINPITTLVTLGLSYWTKFSDIDYMITREEFKILKLDEKNSRIKKSIFENELKLKNIEEEIKKKKIESSKEIENLMVQIESKKSDFQELKKDLEINKKNLKNLESNLKELEKLRDEKKNKIKSLKNKKKIILESGLIRIQNKINEILELQKKNFSKLRELKEKINSQKTRLKKEGKIIISN